MAQETEEEKWLWSLEQAGWNNRWSSKVTEENAQSEEATDKASALCVLADSMVRIRMKIDIQWIICETCENWFHETCADAVNDLHFTCNNCKKHL